MLLNILEDKQIKRFLLNFYSKTQAPFFKLKFSALYYIAVFQSINQINSCFKKGVI